MAPAQPQFDPHEGDSRRYGFSLAQMAELILPCLDAIGARSVAEVGAYAGDFTRVLVQWAQPNGARVIAIDPTPQPRLAQLGRDTPELELICETGLAALKRIMPPDAVIIDGDHNYYTVSEELRGISERALGADFPLVLLHDVGWPHGRRDDYFDPRAIPEAHRQPVAGGAGGLFPGEPRTRADGLPYPRSAAREGGPRNGVLTAAEDFVAGRGGMRLVVVPIFFGLGAIWHEAAPWNEKLARLLAPWDSNPILARLEASRVHHLAEGHARLAQVWSLQARQARYEKLLRRLLQSSAVSVAERMSRLRVRAGIVTEQPAVSKDEIRRALSE